MTKADRNSTEAWISVKNCQAHNLKGISLQIPLYRLTLVCGVSGSGKSTLAHDVLFAEGQGRFLESFSAYDRLFHTRLDRSFQNCVENVPPALVLGQTVLSSNPRSTLATLSDLLTPIRMLYARFTRFEDGSRPSRSHLSFNHPLGMCPACKGLGETFALDLQALIRDENRTLRQGALSLSTPNGYIIYSQVTIDVLDTVCKAHGFSVDLPWKNLTDEEKHVVMFGSDRIEIPFGKHPLESRLKWSGIRAKPREMGVYRGIIPIMEDILRRDPNPNILRFCQKKTCSACDGLRLSTAARKLTYRGTPLSHVLGMRIEDLHRWSAEMGTRCESDGPEALVLGKLSDSCGLLEDLSMGHLHLNRPVSSLSRSEVQSIRIAGLLGHPIGDMLYVLDEPASGLHPKEKPAVYRLIRTLLEHRCTILLVSHDQSALEVADWVVEVGPGGGETGGQLLFSDSAAVFRSMIADRSHATPTMAAWTQTVSLPQSSREKPPKSLAIAPMNPKTAAGEPLYLIPGGLNAVSGVSGSGKTSLLAHLETLPFESRSPQPFFTRTVTVNQQPLGKNSRSNPATYTGLFDDIRSLFARQPGALARRLGVSAFSFNSPEGACPECQGAGEVEVTLHHLTPLRLSCEVCQRRRYQPRVLEVTYRGLAIDEVLNLTISRAVSIFAEDKRILRRLCLLEDLGLGYLTLGQPSSSLSGGEAQRVRLASFMALEQNQGTLYLLDEPCQGLHDVDIPLLVKALQGLARQGATLVAAENNPRFLAACDHTLCLGEKTQTTRSRPVMDNQPTLETTHQIQLFGLRTHNLQIESLAIPEKAFTVVCGPSGSGKGSLVLETLYKACQRQMAEHLSPYLRDRLALSGSGDYDAIVPFKPALALTARNRGSSPRSTVGTLSGISDTLRVLFSRIGKTESTAFPTRLQASHFSFNHPDGACEACGGLGSRTVADALGWLVAPERSILHGAFSTAKSAQFFFDPAGRHMAELMGAAQAHKFDLTRPWCELSPSVQAMILQGCEGSFAVTWRFVRGKRSGEHHFQAPWTGFNPLILSTHRQKKDHKKGQLDLTPVLREEACQACQSLRLRPDSLRVRIGRRSLGEMLTLPLGPLLAAIKKADFFFDEAAPDARETAISQELTPLVLTRLEQIESLGLGYLTLARSVDSLSGGELQRLRLAAFVSNRLNHSLFILDEVSRGLHPLDIARLTRLIEILLDKSNSVVAIDHHPLVHQEADWLIELGPGSGSKGGRLCSSGPSSQATFTLPAIPKPSVHSSNQPMLTIRHARLHNLKDLDLIIPAQGLTVLCGVSGSGKSSLLREIITRTTLMRQGEQGQGMTGLERFAVVHSFIQKTIAPSSDQRLMDFLGFENRFLAWLEGDEPKGKRKKNLTGKPTLPICEHCEGLGEARTDLDYMGSFSSTCSVCQGTGLNLKASPLKRDGLSLGEILLTELDALPGELIEAQGLAATFSMLASFSLGHLSLNRRMAKLSAGELNRLHLAQLLLELGDQPGLLLLDEPDNGLSVSECARFIETLKQTLCDRHAALVVSHHPLFMVRADHLLDLGPGAGDEGGEIVAQGSPWDLVHGSFPRSGTARFLQKTVQRMDGY
jgi:excinuclease ABC subunit A